MHGVPKELVITERQIAESIAEPVGAIMEVLSADEGTNLDIPMWAKKMQYEFLGTIADAGFWRIFVKKSK